MTTQQTVSRWMTPAPWTLDEKDTVERAEELFRAHHIRHLPITRDGRLAGVLSERDMFVAAQFAQTRSLGVGILMASDPVVVSPNAALSDVAERLHTTREGVAIVVETGRIVGVFTAVDALRALAGNPAAVEAALASDPARDAAEDVLDVANDSRPASNAGSANGASNALAAPRSG